MSKLSTNRPFTPTSPADPDRLRRDLESMETVKRPFSEAKEATPVQQITSPRTISTEQERTALGLGQEELIRALPDWLLSAIS